SVEPSRTHAASESLRLMNANVGLEHYRRQIIRDSSDSFARIAPMKWNSDLMKQAPVDVQLLNPIRHHRASFNRRARRFHDHPSAMLDSIFFRQRRTDLDKHLRLQLVKPTVEAAHWPTQIMFGESMGRGNDWIVRIHRRGYRIQQVLAMRGDRILSLFVQQVGNGRFDWLIMRRQ